MSSFPWRLVTVDIDGTITRVHGWREIARTFGRLAEFDDTTRRFRAGTIGEDEHLSNLLDIAAGHTVTEVEAVLERTPVIDGIAEGITRLHAQGARAALLTHNPDYVAAWYRRRFGFDAAEGVASQPIVHGQIGRAVGTRADKPGGMRALLARYGVPASTAVHVGDGTSDAEVFRIVGGGVALNSPFPEVNRVADLALSTDDFRVVVDRIAEIRPRT